jgi:uncharacterized membrane protein
MLVILRKFSAESPDAGQTTGFCSTAPQNAHSTAQIDPGSQKMKATVYANDRDHNQPQRNEPGKPAPSRKASAGWLVPAALILLVIFPLTAGVFRLTQLAGGAQITPANARFFASPLPVVLHIVNAGLYAILGAFQFAAGFRRRRPGWHRVAGRILVACGLLVGLSGLWMTIFYPGANGGSGLLYVLRLLFGSAMLVSIILGFVAIRRGDVTGHRAWMMRGYAIGLGAGTQMLTQMAGAMLIAHPTGTSTALLMGAGWVINLAVAEWAIRHLETGHARGKVVISMEQKNVK